MENLLFQINDICEGVITKRPSAHCKTPYVADVSLENSSSILGHSPSLGCCGLAEKDSTVVLSQLPAKKNQTCSHRVELAILQHNEIKMYIGMLPQGYMYRDKDD